MSTTNSIIQVKSSAPKSSKTLDNGSLVVTPKSEFVSLTTFINNLIRYSNVQTPTLMASLIYLNKLRNLLPANAVGMETTRHRIFLAALILSAKTLNDSSPLNKHWTKYTDGLLSLQEVNMAERELIGLLKWNINVKQEDLVIVLQPFLTSIKQSLCRKREQESLQKSDYYRLSNAYSNNSKYKLKSASPSPSSLSLSSSNSNTSITSSTSNYSLKTTSSMSSYSLAAAAAEATIEEASYAEDPKSFRYRTPLSSISSASLNRHMSSPTTQKLRTTGQAQGQVLDMHTNARILV